MKLDEVEYIKFIPGGNATALVIDNNYTRVEKKLINDYILGFDKSIEQVGFISSDEYRLDMAGGEFCGNATRSATMYYLNGKQGTINIKINNYILSSGIDKDNNCFCEIPISTDKEIIKELNKDLYLVKLEGIVFLILKDSNINNNLKEYSMNLLDKYKLKKYKASGVIFLNNNTIKPIVYVKDINTCFYETACGSGTAAVGILTSYLNKKSVELDIYQPSGKIIKVKTNYDEIIKKVEIEGKVESTLKLKKINRKKENL